MAKQNNTKVVTGLVRLSYANVWEPKSINGSDPKYSCSIIIQQPTTSDTTVPAGRKPSLAHRRWLMR